MAWTRIAAQNPQVDWVKKARWVVDGRFWTSCGITTGMDMKNVFVAELHGKEKSATVSLVMEYQPALDPSNDPFAKEIK